MIPGLPLTLGFSPDDALIDYLAELVEEYRFDHAIAKSIVKQLLDTVTADFTNGTVGIEESVTDNPTTLYDYLASTTEDDIYSACYVTYRPSDCRCPGTRFIFFQLFFRSLDLINFDVIGIEMADESLLEYMPRRDFFPTPEERYR
ncbi:MAG: hypothetical protein ACYC7E_21070 [Armatimonadota bacterium]